MTDEKVPLTEEDRALVSTQITSRRSVAHRFALIAGLVTLLFDLQWIFAGLARRSKAPAYFGLVIAVTVAIGLLVWYFGYRLVSLMVADLRAGEKRRITGKLERISSEGNAYGETITYVTLGGERFVTRGRFFDLCRGGEPIVVEVLPRSRVAIAGLVLGDPR
ncbi:hypothetical protein [Polyangium spumosum]|uniref:Uncharacterized protein n=1 Tax=Polyangium spumosum TaxID=889282 RepID=A0A6N7PRD5_9BACT|nr:hypothetical protein [Polyangium spumosum]MRG92785.1 hypothetical protein [Polyangium spumosum]